MLDVICMGSATIDMFVKIEHTFKECIPGEKILMDNIKYETGGGGSNTAASFATLGLNVGYLGKLGRDDHAQRIKEDMKKYGVRMIPVTPSKKPTAFSIVVESSKERDRIIYVYKGAANDLSTKDFNMKKLNARWMFLSTHLGKSYDASVKVIKNAKKKGTKLLFNPSEYLAERTKLISPILRMTDLLVLNKKEAQLLTKSKKDVKALMEDILKRGPRACIITHGSDGAWYGDGVTTLHVKATKIKATSTTGAGDAFTSGFLAAIIKGKRIDDALKIGVTNSCSVIRTRGAKNGLLSWKKAIGGKLKCVQLD